MQYSAFTIMVAFALGWFCSVTSGIIFAYITFRAKRESHETLFPQKRVKRNGPVNLDEFATEIQKDDESGLPDIIKKQNERMAADLAVHGLKGVVR